MSAITRRTSSFSVTIAISGNLSGAFEFSKLVMGVVHLPAAWTAADIGFKVSSSESGTYLPLYDKAGSLVQIASPAISQAHAMPTQVAGCLWVKLWSQSSGSNVAQVAARSLTVDGKA